MEITFFIGNGLDLSLGLATKYKDFYDYLTADDDLTSEDEKKYTLSEDNIFLQEIKKFMENNSTIDVEEGDAEKIDWSDFEQALGAYTEKLKDTTDGERYLDDLQEFRKAFINYIATQESKFDINKDDAKTMFRNTAFYFYKDIRQQDENRIREFLKQTHNRTYNFNFINFNYTNTLTKIINHTDTISTSNGETYKAKAPIHVHRTLKTGTLLGVNDDKQIANPSIFEADDKRDIIKPEMQKYDDSTIVDEIDKQIERTHIFVVYGMSMGITDKIWWEKIANQVINYNKYLIINKHLTDEEKEEINTQPRSNRKFQESVQNEFVNNLDLKDEEKKRLLNKTFAIPRSDYIFQLDPSESKA
ncbi:AbiH family protein [Staphylococcus saprophyticus]|uniref:AbiH family protein n=1 Tax=Staphylococcus saprophyticus TaxID=29385 RepID=UPI001402C595|nr:AbiH family protein [Staphylococcus saprophyticus]